MLVSMVLPLLGGLGLFLFGMQMMSSNLEAVAGSKMKRLIEKLTSNRFLGVAVGAGITAAIQSSSATTVMVVGFINSQLMTLQQAVWIIMGANIGTTVTGLLISLNIGHDRAVDCICRYCNADFFEKQDGKEHRKYNCRTGYTVYRNGHHERGYGAFT